MYSTWFVFIMLCPKQQQHPQQHPLSDFQLSTVCWSAIRRQINRTWMDHHDHETGKRCMQLPGTDSAQNSNTQHKHLGTKFHSYEKQKQQLLKLGEWAAWKIQGGTVVARRLHSVWAHHAPRRPQSLGCYSLNRASWNRSCTVERNSRNSGWVKPWE